MKEYVDNILADKNHHLLVGIINEDVVTSCIVLTGPNLTRNGRPNALIENVLTHHEFRLKGYGKLIITRAQEIARASKCYKIMLMTGTKNKEIFSF